MIPQKVVKTSGTDNEEILLMDKILHQLRLVVSPLFTGFYTSQVVSWISSINSMFEIFFPTSMVLVQNLESLEALSGKCYVSKVATDSTSRICWKKSYF